MVIVWTITVEQKRTKQLKYGSSDISSDRLKEVIVQDIRISESALLWNVLINFILASFLRAKRICQELQIANRVGIHTLHRITLMQKLLKPLAIEPRRMSPYIQQIYIIIRFLLLLRVFIQCTILYTHTYRVHRLLRIYAPH